MEISNPAVVQAREYKVLLVEDEKVICDLAQRMLRSLGYSVTVSRNGREAVEFYKNHWNDISVIILDMVMPVMGGKEAFDNMIAINPELKVLVSTGYSLNGDAQEIMKAGAQGFIQKPFDKKKPCRGPVKNPF